MVGVVSEEGGLELGDRVRWCEELGWGNVVGEVEGRGRLVGWGCCLLLALDAGVLNGAWVAETRPEDWMVCT